VHARDRVRIAEGSRGVGADDVCSEQAPRVTVVLELDLVAAAERHNGVEVVVDDGVAASADGDIAVVALEAVEGGQEHGGPVAGFPSDGAGGVAVGPAGEEVDLVVAVEFVGVEVGGLARVGADADRDLAGVDLDVDGAFGAAAAVDDLQRGADAGAGRRRLGRCLGWLSRRR
jgi:hypothetical protein